MKVLIQDKTSEKFVFSVGSWTDKEEEALDFESAGRARDFCREHQLQEAFIILRHHGMQSDVVLPANVPETRERFLEPLPAQRL